MNFLERALVDKQNQWWKYILNIVIAFLAANTIGAIPLLAVMMYKMMKNDGMAGLNPQNLMDLSGLGISSNLGLFLMIIPFIAGLAALILLFRPFHHRTAAEVINGTKRIRWKRFFTGVIVWGILLALYLIIDYLIDPANYEVRFDIATFLPLILISVLFIPFQTTFEELAFRGYLAQGVGAWTHSRWWVIVIPSVIFGLLHSMNPEVTKYGFAIMMPQYILFGCVFGLISVLDDGIELAMGVHAVNNTFLSIFVTNSSSALQTSALLEQHEMNPYKELLMLVVSSAILIFILAKKYKWNFSILNKRIGIQDDITQNS